MTLSGSAAVQTAAFENVYVPVGTVEVKVQKNLSGRDWTDDDSFTFTLSADDGVPMPSGTTVAVTKDSADYTESFGRITLTAPGT